VQSDSINLSSAGVSITAGGVDKPVTVSSLLSGYGSTYAISMIPQGWDAEAGVTYDVEITGVSPTISYQVQVVDCP
jgi:hypothetical protein